MRIRSSNVIVAAICFVLGSPALASSHLWNISEVYSNADGTVQYIELFTNSNSQQFTTNQIIQTSQGGSSKEFIFPALTPSPTAGHYLLLATAAFARLPGSVTPDFTLDDGFLFTPGGMIDFVGANSLTYECLPIDGILSLHCDSNNGTSCTAASIGANSPTNYAGITGSIDSSEFGCIDNDGDGFGSPGDATCTGGPEEDCDDCDDTVFWEAVEIPEDGIDQNCDGVDAADCNDNNISVTDHLKTGQ